MTFEVQHLGLFFFVEKPKKTSNIEINSDSHRQSETHDSFSNPVVFNIYVEKKILGEIILILIPILLFT